MRIELNIVPGVVITPEEFFGDSFLDGSIALDGYVCGPTRRDPQRKKVSYNHHEGVDRASTLSTCAQVYEELNMGLLDGLQGVDLGVFINDCDQDVALATWLLGNHDLVVNGGMPALNRLVACVDKLDRHAGAYLIRGSEIYEEMAWIFEPYYALRYGTDFVQPSSGEMRSALEAVHSRVWRHLLGRGERAKVNNNFRTLYSGKNWAMVEETGPLSRLGIYRQFDAFVSFLGARPGMEMEGGMQTPYYRYVLGKKSPWVQFDLQEIFDRLNKEEPAGLVSETNRWGGSDTIGGSPRGAGSRLGPTRVEQIVMNVVGP